MKKVLSEDQTKYYAKRITHFLKGFRNRSQYSIQNIADILEMSLSNYRKLEIEGYPEDSKFMNAVETLCAFGSLDNMSLHEFAYYLDNPNKFLFSEIKNNLSSNERNLFGWEKILLEHFHTLDLDTRTEYMQVFMSHKKDSSDLERIIKISLLIHDVIIEKIGKNNLKLFDSLLEYVFTKSKNKSQHRIDSAIELLSKFFKSSYN
ncbi:hypothetical protein [Fluviispira multicolorata]|uniref:Uncharacterized protein n=1 Tax=Fluviispira multicolorata TaxID=2654512 RepID=A0A833JFB2_9BACT|nr:hypothetical protein [Fluviispira multicolorata]KAB8033634.1 hypothetical protein GCL57_02695 [Fluviispira multicolorata]